LTFASAEDDFPDQIALAVPLALDASGAGGQAGATEQPGDADFFRFTAAYTGKLTVRLNAASGSALDSFLTAYAGTQSLLQSNDNRDGGKDSRLQLSVVAGQTYYLQATGVGGTTGGYTLTLTPVPDDFGDDFDHAQLISLNQFGSATQSGVINTA